MSLEAVKASIRDRGDKVSHYSHAQLRAQADAMIGPWLVAKAKERIAERNSKHVSEYKVAANWSLPLNKTHAHNGAGQRRSEAVRVSTDGRLSEAQQEALRQAGATQAFAEKQSGVKTD